MNTTLTIKTDKKLRNAARRTAADLGLPLSTVVNAMLRQFVRDQEITLSMRVPNAITRSAMREAQSRKNVESFDSLEEWKESVRAN